MLIQVLRELETPGLKSLRGIGDKIGVDATLLEQLLSDLENRGYVRKINLCGGGCASCKHVCPFAGGNSVSLSTWEATEKGIEILERLQ
jgi:hypothetical protein